MEFCAERGWASAASGVVIRGAGEEMIRFHQKVGGALVPRPSRRPFDRLRTGAGRSHIQIISSVNSPAGNGYGSTSMDCHYPLRPRADRVVRLHRDAFAAARADRCRAVTISDRK